MSNQFPGKSYLSPEQREQLVLLLKFRFEKNIRRHPAIAWAEVQSRLQARPEKMWSLNEMERTGGEPDVIGQDPVTGEFIFYDCSPESPAGRRNLSYDREGQESRKEAIPKGNAIDMAADMGIELLTETQYMALQALESFDLKTSSWVQTPADVRGLGGALFASRHYGRVFIFANGASAYFGARGFRGLLKV